MDLETKSEATEMEIGAKQMADVIEVEKKTRESEAMKKMEKKQLMAMKKLKRRLKNLRENYLVTIDAVKEQTDVMEEQPDLMEEQPDVVEQTDVMVEQTDVMEEQTDVMEKTDVKEQTDVVEEQTDVVEQTNVKVQTDVIKGKKKTKSSRKLKEFHKWERKLKKLNKIIRENNDLTIHRELIDRQGSLVGRIRSSEFYVPRTDNSVHPLSRGLHNSILAIYGPVLDSVKPLGARKGEKKPVWFTPFKKNQRLAFG